MIITRIGKRLICARTREGHAIILRYLIAAGGLAAVAIVQAIGGKITGDF